MESLIVAATKKTPGISFLVSGDLSIKGNSFTEDAAHFYEPVIDWIDKFTSKAPPNITLTVELEYINTSSTTLVFKALKKLKLKTESGYTLNLVWKYDPEDEDSLELGTMFSKMINHPIIMMATNSK